MNKDILEGKWTKAKGRIRQQWGKLTDDNVDKINGKSQELSGQLQEHYGYTKEKAENEIKKFTDTLN